MRRRKGGLVAFGGFLLYDKTNNGKSDRLSQRRERTTQPSTTKRAERGDDEMATTPSDHRTFSLCHVSPVSPVPAQRKTTRDYAHVMYISVVRPTWLGPPPSLPLSLDRLDKDQLDANIKLVVIGGRTRRSQAVGRAFAKQQPQSVSYRGRNQVKIEP